MDFEHYTHTTLHKFKILLHTCNYTKSVVYFILILSNSDDKIRPEYDLNLKKLDPKSELNFCVIGFSITHTTHYTKISEKVCNYTHTQIFFRTLPIFIHFAQAQK